MITGAGRGLGRALAEKFIAHGDRVVPVVRNDSSVEDLDVDTTIVADLSDATTIAGAVQQADVDEVDILIHNAGVAHIGSLAEQGLEQWRQSLDVNVLAPVELTRVLLPRLRESKGHILFVNSGAGLSAGPVWASYAASKHALKAVADSLRAEERPHGVRVSSLYPSHFDTDMQRQVRDDLGAKYDPARATSVDSIADSIIALVDSPADLVFEDVRVAPPNPLSMSTPKK